MPLLHIIVAIKAVESLFSHKSIGSRKKTKRRERTASGKRPSFLKLRVVRATTHTDEEKG